MTWLFGIKLYALCSLLFSVDWGFIGYRFNKRRVAEIEPIQDIIRAEEIIS
jgi:hypothetical protein